MFITPASCQKTIITLMLYLFLGSDYQYETKLYRSTTSDDVVISFVGDPTITTHDLRVLLEPLKNNMSNGRIIIDLSLWSIIQFSPYHMPEDYATNYCRPILPAIINKNAIEVVCESMDNCVVIRNNSEYPMESEIMVRNDVSSDVACTLNDTAIVLSGTLNPKDTPHISTVVSYNGREYIKRHLELILQHLDIHNEIIIIDDALKLPEQMVCVNSIKSKPLHTIVKPALKFSDNLVFDALYFTLIATYFNGQATSWDQGDAVIKELIKRYFNIQVDDARFVDGSGLSRLNKISLRMLFQILKKGYCVGGFIDALPAPGEINTMLERRQILPITLRAKTGSLGGITCLCGYNLTDNPKLFCFVAQGFPPPLKDMINTVDLWISDQINQYNDKLFILSEPLTK